MKYKAIAAADENMLIGNGLEIPWHIADDFKHFKSTTMGGVILFGKNTWLSLGKRPLKGRLNAVLSRSLTETPPENAMYFKSKADFDKYFENDPRDVWICGGANIYKQFLPDCSEIILSKIKGKFNGDTFFPDISKSFAQSEILLEHPQFTVVRLKRI